MPRTLFRIAAAAVVMSLVAACGSSSKTATPPTTPAATSASSTGPIITIGLANDEGAAVNFPEYRLGAEAAVRYINAHGGVNGSPIKIIPCIADGSPEASVNCANKFVDAKAVAYVSGLDVGSDAALPVLKSAGIPYVTPTAWGLAQASDPDAFALHTAADAFAAASIKALVDGGAKNIANFHYAIPHSDQAEAQYNSYAGKLGVKLFGVGVPPAGADWSAAVATALASKPDALIGFFNETDCTSFVQAARSGGFTGPIAAGSCSDYVAKLGDQAANTISVADRWPYDMRAYASSNVQAQLDIYSQAMIAAGYGDKVNGLARNSFATLIELGEIMRKIDGTVTPAALHSALAATNNLPGFMGPNVDCASHPWPTSSSSCSSQVLQIKVVKGPNGIVRQPVSKIFVNVSNLA